VDGKYCCETFHPPEGVATTRSNYLARAEPVVVGSVHTYPCTWVIADAHRACNRDFDFVRFLLGRERGEQTRLQAMLHLGRRRTRELAHGSLPGRTARNYLVIFKWG
jgi:hypothetical protein